MKTTYAELNDVADAANRYVQQTKQPNKLTYAAAKFLQRYKKVAQKMEEKMEDLRVKHALTDDKTAILRDERGQYRFSTEGMEKLTEGRRALGAEEVEIEPYYATAVPPDLRDDYRVIFDGFLIEPAAEAEEQGEEEGKT